MIVETTHSYLSSNSRVGSASYSESLSSQLGRDVTNISAPVLFILLSSREGEEIEVWGGREEGTTVAVGTCEWCRETGGSGGYREHIIVLQCVHYCMCTNMYRVEPL